MANPSAVSLTVATPSFPVTPETVESPFGRVSTDVSLDTQTLPKQSFDVLSMDSVRSVNDKVENELSVARTADVKKKEEVRGKIGTIFVWGFFGALLLCFVGTMVYNVLLYRMTGDAVMSLDMATIIPLVGSIIGTPLGFVMGYYFKGDK